MSDEAHPNKIQNNVIDEPVLKRFLHISMNQPPARHRGNLWHFSKTEKQHLLLATGAFSISIDFFSCKNLVLI